MGGSRIGKSSARIRAYGAYDELGAELGLARTRCDGERADLGQLLQRLQHELFSVQSELATPSGARADAPRILERHVTRLESDIDRFTAVVPPLHSFVLPAGGPLAAHLHVCRTVARRAERELWALQETEPQRPELLQWANRISGLLFVLSLEANRRDGIPETAPDYSA